MGGGTAWQDARHQFAGTTQQPRERPVLHAVPAMAVTAAATAAATARPTLLAAGVATAVVGPADGAVQGRAGRVSVRQSRTRPLRWRPSQPVREAVEKQSAAKPDLRDCFLCHAWDDRQGAAKELHDLLEAAGVKVWFSEKDLGLGVPMMRAIDKGLAASKIGLVLVTPALLARLPKEGIADKELSTLLQGNRLVPIVHGTTYAALRDVSPMLASKSGLDTSEDTMAVVAKKNCRTGRDLELKWLAEELPYRVRPYFRFGSETEGQKCYVVESRLPIASTSMATCASCGGVGP